MDLFQLTSIQLNQRHHKRNINLLDGHRHSVQLHEMLHIQRLIQQKRNDQTGVYEEVDDDMDDEMIHSHQIHKIMVQQMIKEMKIHLFLHEEMILITMQKLSMLINGPMKII